MDKEFGDVGMLIRWRRSLRLIRDITGGVVNGKKKSQAREQRKKFPLPKVLANRNLHGLGRTTGYGKMFKNSLHQNYFYPRLRGTFNLKEKTRRGEEI